MSEEEYRICEECGAAEMSVSETAEILEITPDELLADAVAVKKYRKGQLQTKLKIRQTVIRMAKEGVPSMTKLYQEIAKASIDLHIMAEDADSKFPSLELTLDENDG